jgi:hypothetical protein
MILPWIAADKGRGRAGTLLQILGAGPDYVQQHLAGIHAALGADSPGRGGIADLVAKTRAVSTDTLPPVHKQHVISEVILRRFTELDPRAGWQLARYDVTTGAPMASTGTGGVGWVEDFVKIDSGATERAWKNVEDSLTDAINAAENGTVLSDQRLVGILRDAIALHHVRHPQTKELHEKTWANTRARRVQEMATTPVSVEAFRRKYGIYPAGPEARRLGAEEALARLTTSADDGALFRLRVEDLFESVCDRFAQSGLEILTPASADKEFLLGDLPALTVDLGTGGASLAQGVGLANATAIVLPLSPRVLAALGPSDAMATAPDALVDQLNTLQVRSAERYVYHRPGAPFASFIAGVRPSTPTAL